MSKTPAFVDNKQLAELFVTFCQTIAALRDPKTGCPWDLQQTHRSLRRYMLEEAYEAFQVMGEAENSKEVMDELCGELGDVLLQVVLNAQLASERGDFTVADVVAGIEAKMKRRHPHVFTPDEQNQRADGPKKWDEIKQAERKKAPENSPEQNPFAKLAKLMPASLQALEIGKLARRLQFDWAQPDEVFRQLESEMDELKQAGAKSAWQPSRELEMELGDVYFSLAQLCRHLGLDPETVAMDGNQKFLRRFDQVCALAKKDHPGAAIENLGQKNLEELWQKAKKL